MLEKAFNSLVMATVKIQLFPSWPYDEAVSWMKSAHALVTKNRRAVLVACGSHRERVITLGKNHTKNGLEGPRIPKNAIVRPIDRGGGATAHEPGQIVLYPVFNTKEHGLNVPQLITLMEQTLLDFIEHLGLCGKRSVLGPGAFIEEKKVGFVGLRIKEHITSHGLAINVLNDAEIFKAIDPCGIKDLCVTSLTNHIKLDEPLHVYMKTLASCFQRNWANGGNGNLPLN